MSVSQSRRLAIIVTNVAALAHDGINEEVPASLQNFSRARQTVANETPIGVFRRHFGDSRSEQKAGKKPAEICGIAPLCQNNPKFFRVKRASLQSAPRHVRELRVPRMDRPRVSGFPGGHLARRISVS